MPAVKIGAKHQVTIPKEVFEKLQLKAGEWVEAVAQDGKLIFIPKQLTDKRPIPRLNKGEQKILSEAKEKIAKINTDALHSVGLNNKEIKGAVKAGLIDPDQAWWWHEDWQKGEREATEAIKKGEVLGPFENAKDAINALKRAKV